MLITEIRNPAQHPGYSVYRYTEIERREIDGRQCPVFVLRRVAGPYTTEADAREERDAQAMVEMLSEHVAMTDSGEVWGV